MKKWQLIIPALFAFVMIAIILSSLGSANEAARAFAHQGAAPVPIQEVGCDSEAEEEAGLCDTAVSQPGTGASAQRTAVRQTAVLANIVVNTTTDELNNDGDCSLREAIQAANTDTTVDACSAGSGADVISVPPGFYQLTLVGAGEDNNATGDLDISSSLTINSAAGVTIAGNSSDRVFHVITDSVTVEINDVFIQSGKVTGNGGGILNDGGSLTLNNATVWFNQAATDGGGIAHNGGTTTLNNSIVRLNTANDDGGGIGSTNGGTINIFSSSIQNNTAVNNGGGIFNMMPLTPTLNILDSAIRANNSGNWGGGLWNAGVANIANTTISGNSAANNGGGINNRSDGAVNLTNVTISDNTADGNSDGIGDGGGVHNQTTGNFTLKNSLVADNVDSSSGAEKPDIAGSLTTGGYNLIGDRGTESFISGIGDLVGSSGSPVAPLLGNLTGLPAYHPLMGGSPALEQIPPVNCAYISSDGNPLFANGSAVTADQRGVSRPQGANCDMGAYEATADVTLTKLVDDAGPTAGQTINYTIVLENNDALTVTGGILSDTIPAALALAGPIIIDPPSAGVVGAPPTIATNVTIAGNSMITVSFPATIMGGVGGGTHILNIAELSASQIITAARGSALAVVNNCQAQIDGNGTIYANVQTAVDAAASGNLVKVAGYCAGTETKGSLQQIAYISKTVTVRGGYPLGFGGPSDPDTNPTTLDAIRSGRVVYITGSTITVTIENLTLTGAEVLGDGGGLYSNTDGTVNIMNSVISGNRVTGFGEDGGGIANRGDGNINIQGSVISDNELTGGTGSRGGGIFNFGGSGTVNVINSAIINNTADDDGGGLYAETAPMNIANTTIFGNLALGEGGGMRQADSTATLSNVTIYGNRSEDAANPEGNGGGIHARNGAIITMTNSIVAGNFDDTAKAPDMITSANGIIASTGYNFISSVGDFNFDTNTVGDQYGDPNGTTTPNAGAIESATLIDPLLKNLAGDPPYLPLFAASPALDVIPLVNCTFSSAGNNPFYADGQSVTVDQRGVARPKFTLCDIGAYELDQRLIFLPVILKN